MLFMGLLFVSSLRENRFHYLQGKTCRYCRGTASHFYSYFNSFQYFIVGRSCCCCLLDVPLHAGFAIHLNGYADCNEFFFLFPERAVGKRHLLHLKKGFVDFRAFVSQFFMSPLSFFLESSTILYFGNLSVRFLCRVRYRCCRQGNG